MPQAHVTIRYLTCCLAKAIARQLTVNLSNVKVVGFEAQHSDVPDFLLNGAVGPQLGERVNSYNCKYLGFKICLPRQQRIDVRDKSLVAAARKAMFAMWRRCAFLNI